MGEDNGKTVMTKEDYMRLALDIARKGRALHQTRWLAVS